MTVGRAADYYYRYGKKPSKDQLSQFAENAANLAKKLPILGEDSAQQRVEAQKELATGEAGTEKLPSNGQVPGDTGRL
jgi:hypothetical protein